jgi:phosphoribosylformylglycinamidine synthase
MGQLGDVSPDVEDGTALKNGFLAVQEMIAQDLILSGHDRSDGGLITTLLEMAFSGNCGLEVSLQGDNTVFEAMFAEELGLVIECRPDKISQVENILAAAGVPAIQLGTTTESKRITVNYNGEKVLDEQMIVLRGWWEETSYQLERLQMNPACADEEKANIYDRKGPSYSLSFIPKPPSIELLSRTDKPKVAILRDEGSNSDREMTSAFYLAGFEPWDICMSDLLAGTVTLDDFRGLAAVGGFSYADVPESAKGWAATILFNPRLKKMFEEFYQRPNTFTFGICNGCQLFGLLGWIPETGLSAERQPRFVRNVSGRFESRWTTVKVQKSNAMMLKGMEDLVFGIHVDHGEGKLHFPDKTILDQVKAGGMTPLVFVDDDGNPTEKYPFNPNGSIEGLAGLCSADGRHLALMPHPERVFLPWQAHYLPEELKGLQVSPWMQMFMNAYAWCQTVK